MVNRKQFTPWCYIYKNKFSRLEDKVNKEIVENISNHFGKPNVQRGKKFIFLSMGIELTDGGKVEIVTNEYIQ